MFAFAIVYTFFTTILPYVYTSGEIDNKTLRMMNKPRCGISDVDEGTVGQRNKRYNLKGDYSYDCMIILFFIDKYSGDIRKIRLVPAKKYHSLIIFIAKWNKKDITYRITRYTNDLSQAQVDSEIARAFRVNGIKSYSLNVRLF